MDDLSLARALLERGLLSDEEYAEALAVQKTSGKPLADVLVELQLLTKLQVDSAVEALDHKVRFCAACNVPVFVPRDTPEGQRCPRCLGLVEWHRENVVAQIQDLANIVQLAADELPPDVDAARRQAARLFGKYILLEELGRGGAGVVQKAWDTMLGQYVALKFIKEFSSLPGSVEEAKRLKQEQIRDLLVEARAALRLRHPNIVPVHDAGRINDQFYLAMQFIEGDTLFAHIQAAKTRGRLSSLYEDPVVTLRLVRDVCNAVHYAHTFPTPIVHCDLKPANILIGLDGTGYVMDFGLARMGGQSDDTRIRGTPAYMAPAQLTGKSADIYALGAILYDLVAGQSVFAGDTPDIWSRATTEMPERPTDVVRRTTEVKRADSTRLLARVTRLEVICMRCLAKDPKNRYSQARDVAVELETVLAGLDTGDSLGLVPATVADAQRGAEFRRIDQEMTGLHLEAAIDATDSLDRKYADTSVKAWVADRRGRLQVLNAFRGRLVQRLNERRPIVDKLLLVDCALDGVEVLKALPDKLLVLHKNQAVEVVWGQLSHPQLVELAELVQLHDPPDRLALCIYSHHARLVEPALHYADLLRGTPLEAAARQVMKSKDP